MLCLLGVIASISLSSWTEDKRVWVPGKDLASPYPPSLPLYYVFPSGLFSSSQGLEFTAPLKVSAFLCEAVWRRISTVDWVQELNPRVSLSPQICLMCRCYEESVDHLLIHCPVALLFGRDSLLCQLILGCL